MGVFLTISRVGDVARTVICGVSVGRRKAAGPTYTLTPDNGGQTHLHLYRVLCLRLLSVQELYGHDHLSSALQEHYLGRWP